MARLGRGLRVRGGARKDRGGAALTQDDLKRWAAEAAVAEVADGMIVGLGTGSTAAFAIETIGRRVREGLRIEAVATSRHTEAAARAAGIPLRDLADLASIDIAIDGVDEIDSGLAAIKGAGGAMLREKVVARAARRMIAIADGSKRVDRLGGKPVPIEVLPLARALVMREVVLLGAEPIVRADTLSDQGNLLIDCRFFALDDLARLAASLSALPGLLGHGLFLDEIDALYLADADGVTRSERATT